VAVATRSASSSTTRFPSAQWRAACPNGGPARTRFRRRRAEQGSSGARGRMSRCCRSACMAAILSPSEGKSLDTVVSSLAMAPTVTSRPPSVAASRMASATRCGSIIGEGSVGSVCHVVAGVLRIRRIDRRRLDQRDRHRCLVELLQFHAQGIGKTLYRVLGCRIHALVRNHRVRHLAADVDQRTAAPAQVRQGNQRAVDHAPEVGVEQAPAVRFAASSSRP